jgi:hypothetical protein
VEYPGAFTPSDSIFSQFSCDLDNINDKNLQKKYEDFIKDVLGYGPLSFENVSNKITEVIQACTLN